MSRIHGFLVFVFILNAFVSKAQTDTAVHPLKEVMVTGIRDEKTTHTSTNISAVTSTTMRRNGSFNISDGLAKVPGISQLSTGVAISKPVIRGLYGSRVLTLVNGLRFDNQQWQDEHGLGLADFGIDRVEVIKGPMSVLYGTDALGGVLNVIEEEKAPLGLKISDYHLHFNSNTMGGMMDAGVKARSENSWWRIRAGVENNADYSDGGGTRVLNSRFGGYYLKAGFGKKKGRWISDNNYDFSMNQFGFIMPDLSSFIEPDARWSRSMEGPHHNVIFNILSTQNKIQCANGLLKLNGGFQHNWRMEDEGGGAVSLNMVLMSGLYNLQWLQQPWKNTEWIVSHSSTFENNSNYGSRIIIPDANMFESNLASFLKHSAGRIILEAGAGGTEKYIQTFRTRGVNTPERPIHPFNRNTVAWNGMLGIVYNPDSIWNFKLNAATGVRAPNLAELSSNGLHEGIFTYEIGDPTMRNERNLNVDLGINYTTDILSFALSVYDNRFRDFIYLQPTGEDFFGFPVFRFRQQNARLRGGEAGIRYSPAVLKGVEISASFSTITGTTADGKYIPYMPASKAGGSLKYSLHDSKKLNGFYITAGMDYVFAQDHPAENETGTPSYILVNAGFGGTILVHKKTVEAALICNNLLNEKYVDHLSRFKFTDHTLYNIGRNISLDIRIPFSKN
jgi:iron complex outermembrane receptor protein